MLDDLKYIHQRDAQDALGIAEKQTEQLAHEFQLENIPSTNIVNIVYAGMGGSALAAQLSTSWPGHELPFEICRQYDIPAYVNSQTLFIAASYSGNTEETLSALAQAEERQASIVIIAGDGKLQEVAMAKGYPYLTLPKAAQPRYATFYNLKALLTVLVAVGLYDKATVEQGLIQASANLEESIKTWLPTVPAAKNPAKQLAQELMGRSPVLYAGPKLAPAAYKWKISFNENAKNIAWAGTLPEFNHNEFIGWSSHPIDKPYAVIDLRSSLEHPRIQKRFEVSERLLSGKRPATHIVEALGSNLVEQLLWTVVFGDFVSIYLGLLNGVDPTPVELVEKLKKELA